MLFFARVLCHLWSSKKRASARCTVFYNGFCTPKVPEVGAVLFFASVLKRLPVPPALAPARLAAGLCRREVDGKPSTRVAGVRFVSKTRVLFESGNVF